MATDASQGDGFCVIDETSPDMLKNTPSNIQRLADVIDQYEGRRKYLAQTESPSDGGDVRWYFCKVPLGLNQLAPSIPQTEIVGKGEYFRFGMRDSLAIEAAFLQREEELLSHWWKEYAECSIGPKERTNLSSTVDLKHSTPTHELFAVEEERVGVPVKGGLYEVDLVRRHSFPVYWNGENRRVLRGHWFAQSGGLDWLPLREDVAEQLEFAYRRQVWHRRTFQPSGLFAARVDLQGSTPGLHALFTGEDATWEAWLNVDASGFSSVINFGRNGIKLRRGYAASQSPKPTQDELRQQREEEMDDYCSEVPVRHLVFMVHGIGQRLEKSNLVDDVTNFRLITSSLAEKHLTSHQRGTQRVLYIPCQWRKGLKLSSESTVEKITLDGVRGLRTTLSATVHDVLYYMSPIHCQDIIDSVSNQLNRLYVKFLKRNPGYKGKVSIYGHSLGSVLSYDILCHQENVSAPFPMDCMYREQGGENQLSGKISKPSSEPQKRLDGFEGTAHAIKEQKMGENESLGNISNLSSRLKVKFDGAKGTLYIDDENNAAPLVLGKEPCKGSLPAGGEQSSTNGMKEEISRSDFSSSLDCHESASNCFDTHTMVKEILDEGTNYNNQDMLAQSDTTRLNVEKITDETSGETSAGNKEFMASKERVALLDTNRAHVAVSASLTEHITDETSGETSLTNKEIMALKEKIGLLSARVMDLESQVCVKETSASDRRYASQNDATRSSSEQDEPNRYKPYIKYTKLKFQVDTFFAVGSPLGVFLALRNVRIGIGKGKEYWEEENIIEEMPGCRRMFNIFHPFDPVAYRLEPLVCKEYIIKRPVIIPYHRGGKRLHVGLQDFVEDVAAHSQAVMDRLNSVREKVLTICQSKDEGLEEEEVNEEERSYGSMMIEQLTGSEEGRIDHSLQYMSRFGKLSRGSQWEDYPRMRVKYMAHMHNSYFPCLDKTFQHPYLSVLGAHTNYWRDHDTALFMLKHLYEDIPQQFQQPIPSHQDNMYTGNEFTDEELPLTFSESSLLRKSAQKARWGKRGSS